eukprot:gene9052-1370_t
MPNPSLGQDLRQMSIRVLRVQLFPKPGVSAPDVYVELGELAEATRQKTTVSKRTWNASFEDTAKNKFGLLVKPQSIIQFNVKSKMTIRADVLLGSCKLAVADIPPGAAAGHQMDMRQTLHLDDAEVGTITVSVGLAGQSFSRQQAPVGERHFLRCFIAEFF